MVWQAAAIGIITVLLFFLMLTRKAGRIKLLLGLLTGVCALATMALYLWMLYQSGGADKGKEVFQLYLPCGLCLLLAAWGWIAAALSQRKLRLNKAAKLAGQKKAQDPQ
jgi:hypothetical protein